MCFINRSRTIEEIIAQNSVGMTDQQKAEYWYELCQTLFRLLGKVDIQTFKITAQEWEIAALLQYPTLTELKLPDEEFVIASEADLQTVLSRDWTNLVPYVANISDCDDFGIRLYDHLVTYYGLTGILPVWGDTDQGYHGYNLAVFKDGGGCYARLIEPQTDDIFISFGPLGNYTPEITAVELGIHKKIL